MDGGINFTMASMPPLPAPLAQALATGGAGLAKRERTRRQLLEAAVRVIAARGLAQATIHEIAGAAGMTPGTVYNHFSTREEVVKALALWLGDTLCQRITDSQQGIAEGAERMSIGIRRYLWLAGQSPAWALLLMQVAMAAPQLVDEITVYSRADLRLGLKQKAFRVPNEDAAIDMISGTVLSAMQSIVRGNAAAGYGQGIAAMVLRGLGMGFEAATEVARRPLPDFPPLGAVARPAPGRVGKAEAKKMTPVKVAAKVTAKSSLRSASKSVSKLASRSAPKGAAKATRGV